MHMHTHRLKAQCQGPWWLEAYERVGLTRGCQVYGNKRNSQANESQNLWHTRAHTQTDTHRVQFQTLEFFLRVTACVCVDVHVGESSVYQGAQRLLLIGKCDDTTQEAIDLPSDGDWFNSSSFQVCVCMYRSPAVHSVRCNKEYTSITLSVFASFTTGLFFS